MASAFRSLVASYWGLQPAGTLPQVFPGVLVAAPTYPGGSLIGVQGVLAPNVGWFTEWNAIDMTVPGPVAAPLDGLPLGKLWRHRSPNQLLPAPYPVRGLITSVWVPGAATGRFRWRMTAEVLRVTNPALFETVVEDEIGIGIGAPYDVTAPPAPFTADHVAILPILSWGFAADRILQIRMQPEVLGPPFFPAGTGTLTLLQLAHGPGLVPDPAAPALRVEIDTDQGG